MRKPANNRLLPNRQCQWLALGLGVMAVLLPVDSVASSSRSSTEETAYVSAARRTTWPQHLPVISHTVNEELFGIMMSASYGPEWRRRLPEPLIRFHWQRFVIGRVIRTPY